MLLILKLELELQYPFKNGLNIFYGGLFVLFSRLLPSIVSNAIKITHLFLDLLLLLNLSLEISGLVY